MPDGASVDYPLRTVLGWPTTLAHTIDPGGQHGGIVPLRGMNAAGDPFTTDGRVVLLVLP